MAAEANAPPSLPSYPQMIMEAVGVLAELNGTSKSAISNYIETKYEDLPAGHSTLLAHHLTKLKDSGELIFAQNNYMKPDRVATPKRGRGRPRKEKVPVAPDIVFSSPRPRGRPPKPRDPLAVASSKASDGMPKRRGRPPKPKKMIMEAVAVLAELNGTSKAAISNYIDTKYEDLPAGHTTLLAHHLTKLKDSGELIFAQNNYMKLDTVATLKRGRGRPRKEKVAVSPGTVPSSPRPRGRPPKPKVPLVVASSKVSDGKPKRRGRPTTRKNVHSLPKVEVAAPVVTGVKRGRGRPPKVNQPLVCAESSLTRSNADGLDVQ